MPTLRSKPNVLTKLQDIHGLNEGSTARGIGCDRATLRRIKDGSAPSAAFIAGAVLLFQVPVEALFEVVDEVTAPAA
ncbi:hypothetical protein [Gordonia sp. MMO-8]|uniref:hypothetical protein n=1 Tax=Gordonia sp. MMO-8 TaxID=3127886 RepID=UPI003018D737